MATERYDIFQLDEGQPVWLECVPTIESLRSRLQDLQLKYAHLMVYDSRTDSKLKPIDVMDISNTDALEKI